MSWYASSACHIATFLSHSPFIQVPQCPLTVDIVLRSCDKELIGAHKLNLAQYGEAFPAPGDVTSPDEPVDLSENAKTLRLLMHFMHSHRFPSLLSMDSDSFQDLIELAGAAEKYMVHSAMAVCNLRLSSVRFSLCASPKATERPFSDESLIMSHGIQTLAYSMKYNYPEIADKASPWTLAESWDNVANHLGDDRAQMAWVCRSIVVCALYH